MHAVNRDDFVYWKINFRQIIIVRTCEPWSFKSQYGFFTKQQRNLAKESHNVALCARSALVELEFMFLFRYVSINSFKFHKIIANLRVCKSTTREVNLKFLGNLRLLLLVSRFRFTTRKICRDSRKKFTAETEVARGDVELLIDSAKGSVDRRKFAGPVQLDTGTQFESIKNRSEKFEQSQNSLISLITSRFDQITAKIDWIANNFI